MDVFFKDANTPKSISSRHGVYFDKASKIAMKSCMNHQHGCVIVSDEGEILAHGYNRVVDFMCHQFSIHAEVDAICKLKRNRNVLASSSMYIVRISPKTCNLLKYSRPCENCQKLIEKYAIKRVYYSTNYEFDKICGHLSQQNKNK